MADVNGTINVEVLYREAGSPGSGSTSGSGGGSADGSGAAEDKKKTKAMSDSNKFLKGILGSMTVGALIKQSKIGSSFLGTLAQLIGALIDVFLMPFIPLLIPVLKFLAKVVTWFAKFMQDPALMLKEAFWASWNAVKDAIMGLFSKDAWTGVLDNITSPDWLTILNPKNWLEAGSWAVDKVVPLLVGGAGIWAMTKVLGFMFGTAGVLKDGIMSMLGLGGGKTGITDMLAKSKCCAGGGAAAGGAAGAATWLTRFGTKVTNWGLTISIAAQMFKDRVVAAGAQLATRFGMPLVNAVLPVLQSTVGTAIATTFAAGALAVTTIAGGTKAAAMVAGLPEVGPASQMRATLDHLPRDIREGLEGFHKDMLASNEWVGGVDPRKQASDFKLAFSQFGDRGVINQMKAGMFGEAGQELVIKLDLSQEGFETRYKHEQTTEYRMQQNDDAKAYAHIME
jgi:hypothetical protein